MADLTTHVTWTCATNVQWFTDVKGSTGNVYTVRWGLLHDRDRERQRTVHGWTCTCVGFRRRGQCRHTARVEASGERCGWNSTLELVACDRGEAGDRCCPSCGGEVEAVKIGV